MLHRYRFVISIAFIILLFIPAYPQDMNQDRITLSLQNVTLAKAFKKIEEQSSLKFVYENNTLNENREVTVQATNQPISQVVGELLTGTNTKFKQVNYNIIISSLPPPAPVKKAGEPATLSGSVKDDKTGETLPGATILVEGTDNGTITDFEGNYILSIKEPGTYNIQCSFVGYETVKKTITLAAGETKKLDFSIQSTAIDLQEVVIYAKAQLSSERANIAERKISLVAQDAISHDFVMKSASITTTQALSRVTGLSISSDGKYASIRGMSDRDIVAQLNGARLSSANNDRNSVPLDLVPAQLLDAITVQKTVTPDRPGDATAGIIELKTKAVPDTLVIAVSGQFGYNDAIGLGGNVNSFKNAELGFFGQKTDVHRLSPEFTNLMNQYASESSATGNSITKVNMENVLRNLHTNTFYNQEAKRIDAIQKGLDPVFYTTPRQAPANQIYSITLGNSYKLFGRELGLVAGINYYSRSETIVNGRNSRYSLFKDIGKKAYFGANVGATVIDLVTPNRLRLINNIDYEENTGIQTLNYGALAALTYRISSSNEVSVNFITNIGAESTATRLSIAPPTPDSNGLVLTTGQENNLLRTVKRDFTTLQLRGVHQLKIWPKIFMLPVRIEWNASNSQAAQEDPDFRTTNESISFTGDDDAPYTYSLENGSGRFFRKLDEKNKNYTLDLTFPTQIFRHLLTFKVGGYYLQRKRDYTETSLPMLSDTYYSRIPGYDLSSSGSGGNLEKTFGPGGVALGYDESPIDGTPYIGWLYVGAKTENNYQGAKQEVGAFYGMLTTEIKKLKLVAGARFENTIMNAKIDTAGVDQLYVNYGDIKKPGLNDILLGVGMTSERYDSLFVTRYSTNFQFLPSVTAIYSLPKSMQLRASYSKTLGRPELNEIIFSNQYSPTQQAFTRGNNTLVNQYSQNIDLRWEWFPDPNDLYSASVFYKSIEGKLEKVTGRIPNPNRFEAFTYTEATYLRTISTQNNPNTGTVLGIEVELRKNLAFISSTLKNFNVGFNGLLAQSSVKLTPQQDSITRIADRYVSGYRPLFQQPPFVINANIQYSNSKGTSLNLFYNVVGERLIEIQVDGTPNIYEQPFPILDFTVTHQLTKRITLNGFAKNLLNSEYRSVYTKYGQDGKYGTDNETYVRSSYRRGREIAIGFSFTF